MRLSQEARLTSRGGSIYLVRRLFSSEAVEGRRTFSATQPNDTRTLSQSSDSDIYAWGECLEDSDKRTRHEGLEADYVYKSHPEYPKILGPRLNKPTKVLAAVLSKEGYFDRKRYKTIRSVDRLYSAPPLDRIMRDLTILSDTEKAEESLGLITAHYIYSTSKHFLDDSDQRLRQVFTEGRMRRLRETGFDLQDVVSWGWVLTAPTDDRAVDRLALITSDSEQSGRQLPAFLLMAVINFRAQISANGLRLLLQLFCDRFSSDSQGVGYTLLIAIQRLILLARKVWPGSLIQIVELLRLTSDKNLSTGRLKTEYNLILELLGEPAEIHPFLAVTHQQKAQFAVLKRMAEHHPPLSVTLRGYRGITRLQLRHKRTEAEQQWHDYKAASWPPWKQARLGIDEERGNEGKQSRALQTLLRSTEAGFAETHWASMARIYSGWDLDGSPTIQKRVSVPPEFVASKHEERPHLVWAARVRATRTRREAWACFLAYRDSDACPHEDVYLAMFEKVLLKPKISSSSGDGLEPLAEPRAPHEITYVPSDPPSADELLDMMVADGVRPSIPRNLAFLVRRAPTLGLGLRFIYESSCKVFPEDLFINLLDVNRPTLEYGPPSLDGQNDAVFAAFVMLLCRCYKPGTTQKARSLVVWPERWATRLLIEEFLDLVNKRVLNTRELAEDLVFRLTPSHLPAWIPILVAKAKSGRRSKEEIDNLKPGDDIWRNVAAVLPRLKRAGLSIDMVILDILCKALHADFWAGFAMSRSPLRRAFVDDIMPALGEVKIIFDQIVGSLTPIFGPASSITASHGAHLQMPETLPRLLAVPQPAVLHRLIRIMGLAGDYDGIMSLLHWMREHQSELQEYASEFANGPQMMRRAMVAVRIGLERWWENPSLDDSEWADKDFINGASDEILHEAFELVESVESWGGWPTPEEVLEYHQKKDEDPTQSLEEVNEDAFEELR